jgi:hypothetical protein
MSVAASAWSPSAGMLGCASGLGFWAGVAVWWAAEGGLQKVPLAALGAETRCAAPASRVALVGLGGVG